jgi:hypothetical protein
MSYLNQQYCFIRVVGTEYLSSGYGAYATPKLYTKGSAASVVGKKNKENEKHNNPERWEVVPVTITVGEPL